MSRLSSIAVALLRQAIACLLLAYSISSTVLAQNAQSELLGVNGDGASLQSALVGGQLSYAHINSIGGTLKFASLTSAGWAEQILASGFGAGSNLSLQVSPSGVAHMAVLNGSAGILSLYTRASNGAWSSEIVRSGDTKGRPSLYVGASEILISFSTNTSGDLLVARKTTGSWTTTTVDASANVVGGESSISVGQNTNAAVAYLDETSSKLKVAVTVDRINWTVETLDYPGAKFGKFPHLVWLANNEISVLAGDILQNNSVSGQSLIHAQRSATGQWTYEQIGHPASASQSGKFVASTDDRNAAMIARSAGVSSIINVQRTANGLWGGVIALIAPAGESLSDLSTAYDSVNTLNYFSRANIGTQTFVRRASGIALSSTPTESTPPVQPTPAPTPAPTPIPTPEPTPEPRSAIDTDGDGLTDDQEAALGTNPQVQDTDGDGVLDGQEVADKTDPTSANSFAGAASSKICTFWTKKAGISQRVTVNNLVTSTLKYNIEIISSTGQLKGVDERSIAAKTSATVAIDNLVQKSGVITRGQVCVRWTGRKKFLTAKYSEVRTVAAIKKRAARKSASVLEHELTGGEAGNQEIVFKGLSVGSSERIESDLNLQNFTGKTIGGKLTGFDSKGKKTVSVSITINANSIVAFAPSKLKLNSSGKIQWAPNNQAYEVRAVYEQEVEKKVGKSYSRIKIARKDGAKK